MAAPVTHARYKPVAGSQMSTPNVIAMTRDGNIFLRTTMIKKEEITSQVKDRIANRLDKTVYVKSDARAKYGDVVAVVDEIRSAGVDQVGLLTERNERATPPPPPPPQAD